jgi:hypothetical protein
MQVCHKDQLGQYPGKTIVFAVSQKHALRLASVFEKTPMRIRLIKIFFTCTAKILFLVLHLTEEVLKKKNLVVLFALVVLSFEDRQIFF